eukprot:TRINITY_DN27606_c0_g1_i1.p1 TRINITY_DN27606_c0_g1~~TRINITY_DN27606_c0_g1_i1.p1  ORF type:complete len:249 (+),score=53.12 TRINITY_DN27606_c0_g1_i1:67-813(+)
MVEAVVEDGEIKAITRPPSLDSPSSAKEEDVLYVPSEECEDIYAALDQYAKGQGKYKKIELSAENHTISRKSKIHRNIVPCLLLDSAKYAGLTIRGAGKDKTLLSGGAIHIMNKETKALVFQDLAVYNPYGAGVMVEKGAFNITFERCLFASCGGGGFWVSHKGTTATLRDCLSCMNSVSGINVFDSGTLDIYGEESRMTGNEAHGLYVCALNSLIRIHDGLSAAKISSGNKGEDIHERCGGKIQHFK